MALIINLSDNSTVHIPVVYLKLHAPPLGACGGGVMDLPEDDPKAMRTLLQMIAMKGMGQDYMITPSDKEELIPLARLAHKYDVTFARILLANRINDTMIRAIDVELLKCAEEYLIPPGNGWQFLYRRREKVSAYNMSERVTRKRTREDMMDLASSMTKESVADMLSFFNFN